MAGVVCESKTLYLLESFSESSSFQNDFHRGLPFLAVCTEMSALGKLLSFRPVLGPLGAFSEEDHGSKSYPLV